MERIVIYCDEETKKRLHIFKIKNRFENLCQALKFLLDKADEYHWKRVEERIY